MEQPHSEDTEKMVIGCMLTSTMNLNVAAEELDYSDFYFDNHRLIFKILKEASRKGKPADVHLVCEELKRQGKLADIGGAAFVTDLVCYAGTSACIEEYVEMVRGKSLLRRMIDHTGLIKNKAAQDPEDVYGLIDELRQGTEELLQKYASSTSPLQFLDKNKFLSEKPREKPMLLMDSNGRGFLPKSIVAMLVGAGGVGKTHLLAQLAISIASGTRFLDTFTTMNYLDHEKKDYSYEKGCVFFGLGENQDDDIHRILYKASKKLREEEPDLQQTDPLQEAAKRIATLSFCGKNSAFLEKSKPTRYFHQFKMSLKQYAPQEGWSLIILDPVSRLLGADAETDNAAATRFIALLEELTLDLPGNPTVLFAHHVNKASTSNGAETNQANARGSSALTDGVRLQLNFKKSNDVNILKMTKSNFTAFIEEIELTKDLDGFLEIKDKEKLLATSQDLKKQKK